MSEAKVILPVVPAATASAPTRTRERVFSGMRPTGRLHIGHWFGALQNWVRLQDEYDCIYSVVDLHALTTGFQDVSRIHEDGIEMLADWIGAGVDPERSIVFRQSQVPEHAELALLLGMITPKSWLERVPTYKGQIAELGEQIDTFGFFGYPVLQTADIVLYHATKVPVGQDQLPHLELAREIVRRFNHLYGSGGEPVFPEPEALLTEAPILLGIDNRKMSKSYGNAIELGAEPDTIRDMVGRMITDPQKIRRGDPGRPEICNVFSYEKLFGTPADRVAEIDRTCRTGELGCREHKDEIGGADRRVPAALPGAPRGGAARPRRAGAAARAGRRARPRDRGAEHGAREGGDGAVSAVEQPWTLDLEVFEGPFDLLVTLILNEDVDLLEVHLAEIVLAYIERLEARGELDLEAATEFLILIAALLELKSRLMLPSEDEEGLDLEPAEAADELLARLLEYKKFRAASEWMHATLRRRAPVPLPRRAAARRSCAASRSRRRSKAYEPERLADAMRGLLRTPPAVDTSHMTRDHRVARAAARRRARAARDARRLHLRRCGRADSDRMTQAVTLFALLELYKNGELVWRQRETFGAIEIMSPAES